MACRLPQLQETGARAVRRGADSALGPRVESVDEARSWRQAQSLGIAAGEATLLGLWSDGEAVHLALVAGAGDASCWSSALPAPSGASPPSRATHAPALRLERTIRDLYGLEPEGCARHAPLARPRPLGRAPAARQHATRRPAAGDAYAFLSAEGPPLHQIPVGPVHAGIIEPGHFRFTANGETVVRLEERLGYVHKGIDAPDGRRAARAGGEARRPRLRRQHGRLCASPSRARWRQRSGSSRRRARSGCAR